MYNLKFVMSLVTNYLEIMQQENEKHLGIKKSIKLIEEIDVDKIYGVQIASGSAFVYPEEMTEWLVVDLGYGRSSYFSNGKKIYVDSNVEDYNNILDVIKKKDFMLVFSNSSFFIQHSYVDGVNDLVDKKLFSTSAEIDLALAQKNEELFNTLTARVKQLESMRVKKINDFRSMIFSI